MVRIVEVFIVAWDLWNAYKYLKIVPLCEASVMRDLFKVYNVLSWK